MEAWCELNYHDPQCNSEVRNQCLWLNSHIRVNNLRVKWNQWIELGIWTVQDIVDLNDGVKEYTAVSSEFRNDD